MSMMFCQRRCAIPEVIRRARQETRDAADDAASTWVLREADPSKRLVKRRPELFAGRVACFDRNFPGHDLITAILETQSWPDISPVDGPRDDEVRDLIGNFTNGANELEIYAHRGGACLYIDGDPKGAALFAIWYRSPIPSVIDMIFCDDAYSFNMVIRPGMTPAI